MCSVFSSGPSLICGFTVVSGFFDGERQLVVLYHTNIKQKQQLYEQVISFYQGKTSCSGTDNSGHIHKQRVEN